MTALTNRFTEAFDYARIAHASQVRKGTDVPYLAHLISVAGLVLDYGGNEDQAIAGLLHDLLEDCGSDHEAVIRIKFGDAVTAIVNDCTDGSAESKELASTPESKYANWLERKRLYIAHLAEEPTASLLVSACDKLHNARAIVADLLGDAGPQVFDRFTAGREGTLQYYEAIARVFLKRAMSADPRFHELACEFDRTVATMHALAGAAERVPLDGAS